MLAVLLCTPIFANLSGSVGSLLMPDQKYGEVFRQCSRQVSLRVVGQPQYWLDRPSESRLQKCPYYMSWLMQLVDIIGSEIFEVIKMVANGLMC
jgi:hypothetical protein